MSSSLTSSLISSPSTTNTSDSSTLLKKTPSFNSGDGDSHPSSPKIRNSKTMKPSTKKLSISDFTVLSELGRGAYGKVVLAKSKKTNKNYAIKIIDKYFLEKLNKTHEAFIEREMLSTNTHNNIIKLVSSFQNSEKLFYVLNYIKNGTLQHLITKNGIVPKEIAQFYLAQIVSILNYFETKSIAHRDLKPQNILIDENYNIKLIDFATATVVGKKYEIRKRKFVPKDGEIDNEIVGTPGYASPEMLLRKVENEKGCDLFSLGVIMYQLFHGYTPFNGCCEKETIDNTIKGKYIIREDLDEDTKDLIIKLLKYNYNERIGINSINEIIMHPFFHGVDFENLSFEKANLQIAKVFKSKSSSFLHAEESPRDTNFSDNTFEEEEIKQVQTNTIFIEEGSEKTTEAKTDYEIKINDNLKLINDFFTKKEENEQRESKEIIYEGEISFEKKFLFFKKCVKCTMKLYKTKIELCCDDNIIETISLTMSTMNNLSTSITKNNKFSFSLYDSQKKKTYTFTCPIKEGEKWVDYINHATVPIHSKRSFP